MPPSAEPLRLLCPASAAPSPQAALSAFLRALGHNVEVQPDPDAPMLMKKPRPARSLLNSDSKRAEGIAEKLGRLHFGGSVGL